MGMGKNTVNDLLGAYEGMSYSSLLEKARADYETLLPIFSGLAKSGDGKPYVAIFMCTALAADGVFSPLEYTFINDLLGYSYDEAYTLVIKHTDKHAPELADRIFDSCSEELKETLIDFCCCFMAVDKSINKDELAFIARLLA